IIDFGIAAMLHHDSQNPTGSLVGTPNYMSPDQARGESFDACSDIYSLGCIMFEALTGKLPYEADTPLGLLALHANSEIPSLNLIDPDKIYSPGLNEIVAKALAKTKEERFQSMSDFALSIEQINDTHENLVLPDSAGGKSKKHSNLLPITVIALTAIVSLSVYGIYSHYYRPSNQTTDKIRNRPEKGDTNIPNALSDIPAIGGTKKTDKDLAKLRNGLVPEILELTGSDITDKGLTYLVGLPIKKLRINATDITDAGIESVAKIKSMLFVDLSDDILLTGKSLKSLAKLPHLIGISLTGTTLNDDDLRFLPGLPQLQTITLGQCHNITGDGFVYLPKLSQLTTLKIDALTINKTGYENLAKLHKLKWLDLQSSNFSDQSIEIVRNMRDLEMLNIGSTKLTDNGLDKIPTIEPLNLLRIESCPNITNDAVIKFKARNPQCEIRYSTNSDTPISL
ncbi:MAG: protein kinase, partial [Candidatus Obscuribacterales bacterium]|nr:protein kinase [Candidatus Obscuribacterales bacterium]